MLPCPPPPRASTQVIEMLVPAQELCDAPRGFFLAAPCNSSYANIRRDLFMVKNHNIKLLPKKSSNRFEDLCRGFSARSSPRGQLRSGRRRTS